MLMFRQQDRERVARGEITVTYRLWKSAHVKAGKTYETGFGKVAVDDVQLLPAALVPQDDVPSTGCADVAAIWALAGEHTGTPVTPDTLIYRVQFRFLGENDARSAPNHDHRSPIPRACRCCPRAGRARAPSAGAA